MWNGCLKVMVSRRERMVMRACLSQRRGPNRRQPWRTMRLLPGNSQLYVSAGRDLSCKRDTRARRFSPRHRQGAGVRSTTSAQLTQLPRVDVALHLSRLVCTAAIFQRFGRVHLTVLPATIAAPISHADELETQEETTSWPRDSNAATARP